MTHRDRFWTTLIYTHFRKTLSVWIMLRYLNLGWLGSRVVSVLDSGAEGPGFKSQPRRCRVTVLGSHPLCLCSPNSKIGSSPLKGARVSTGLAESNGSLPPGLWLTPPASWLPRTGISSGTLRSAIEYMGYLYHFISILDQICKCFVYRAFENAHVTYCVELTSPRSPLFRPVNNHLVRHFAGLFYHMKQR